MLIWTAAPQARMTRLEVTAIDPVLDGYEFGDVGAYERVKGIAYFAVDPADPRNTVIYNLDRAPKNDAGLVEYSSEFVILRPVDPLKGNRNLWFGVNNRGNCQEFGLRTFPLGNFIASCDLATARDVSPKNILLQEGYIFADIGWHGDGIEGPGLLYPRFPVASNPDGSPITGPLRIEYGPTKTTFTTPIAPGWRPYPPVSTDTAKATLTVRESATSEPRQIPAEDWAFGSCANGKDSLVPNETDLCLFDGFQAFQQYEFVYQAKDPIVMGLAYAVTRDFGSFLRYSATDDAGTVNPAALSADEIGIRHTFVSGTSSTGMYMRDFLYLGFNEDEQGRQVFEGATINSAGAHRLFANVQFAHPTYYARQDQNADFTSNSTAPQTFAVVEDPVTGITDGILKRPETDPKVMQIDEENVFWSWQASLNVIDSAGNDVPVPDNVRLYFQAGFGHVGAIGFIVPPMESDRCTFLTHWQDGLPLTIRALVPAMEAWVADGTPPPASNYPTRDQLVTLAEYRELFPAIPQMRPPEHMAELYDFDFGPDFDRHGGNQTILPPIKGEKYVALVPRPSSEGWGEGGIDTMFTRVPVGTNVGWNLIRSEARHGDICGLSGSYLPFAERAGDRAEDDPRASLEERYGSHAGLIDAVQYAGDELVRNGFMLRQDVDVFVGAAYASDLLR
jgi:hypothetical protein